jgi:hypothetical protein
MKFLQKSNPLVMLGLLKLIFGLPLLQWLVINVDNGFLAHQIVIPLLNNLNQGV